MRTAIGTILGFAAWWFLFFAVGIAFGLLWPAYREAARFMFEGDLGHFTTPMLFLNWLVFLIAGTVTGWVAAFAGSSRMPALIVALLLLGYGLVNHYILVWNELPDWYNLIVPLVIAAPVAIGGRLRKPVAAAQS
jgi:hypothetical protein